jgi:hypothetical protein
VVVGDPHRPLLVPRTQVGDPEDGALSELEAREEVLGEAVLKRVDDLALRLVRTRHLHRSDDGCTQLVDGLVERSRNIVDPGLAPDQRMESAQRHSTPPEAESYQ